MKAIPHQPGMSVAVPSPKKPAKHLSLVTETTTREDEKLIASLYTHNIEDEEWMFPESQPTFE